MSLIFSLNRYLGLLTVTEFTNMITYPDPNKFCLILEPSNETGFADPLLSLACLDSSLALKGIFEKYKAVILTSGTMSPFG